LEKMSVKSLNPRILIESINISKSPINSFQTGKNMAQAWAKGIKDANRIEYARSFTFLIVKSYWCHIHKDKSLLLPSFDTLKKIVELDNLLISLADALGAAASKLNFIEASYQIGNIYTSVLPEDYRSINGIYYTPPSLTYRIIQMAEDAGIDWTSANILDPACGGGAFLAPLALRIATAFKPFDPDLLISHIENHLSGYELDEFSAWLSQVFVEVALNKICLGKNRRLNNLVKVSNSLNYFNQEEKFDLIIGNPPYGKIKLGESKRGQYKEGLYGHANLYGLFTQFAISNLSEKGVIAFVTPTSFLSGEYFKNLRSVISKKCTPLEFDFISFRKGVFENVLQETMLATYQKNIEKNRRIQINELQIDLDKNIEVNKLGAFALPEETSSPWLLPRSHNQSKILHKIAVLDNKLETWGYTVKTGPLVWNRHKSQLRNKKEQGSYPLIWAEAITITGEFLWRAKKQNHTPYFKIEGKKDNWLLTNHQCILMQRTTAKEQNKRLITAILPLKFLKQNKYVVIENHVNIIKPITPKPKVSLEVLNTLLNSEAVDLVFRCISGSVAVSAYELEEMPLPSYDKVKNLEKLIKQKTSSEEIEKECFKIYNLKE
jgi:adenine-specific DNA-methyltransferase